MKQPGLIISLDFELDWGYANLKNPLTMPEVDVHLNRLLKIFETHNVKTTWAIVGKLFTNINTPDSTKGQLQWISNNLLGKENIEVGSHTYSHIFCEEEDINLFKDDVEKVNEVLTQMNLKFNSIVLPRNQYNNEVITILSKHHYTHFRGVLKKWYLKTNKYSKESKLKRFFLRFFEFVPLNRDVQLANTSGMVSLSDSRFLRFLPNNILGDILSPLYLRIVKYEMYCAFKRGNLFHICFHPHNLIKNPKRFRQLEEFLVYYNSLRQKNAALASFKMSEINP